MMNPIKIPINIHAADALDTVANAEVIAHNMPSAIANDLSSPISQASSDSFMKNPLKKNKTAKIT